LQNFSANRAFQHAQPLGLRLSARRLAFRYFSLSAFVLTALAEKVAYIRRADYLMSLANLWLFVEDPTLQGRSARECV
jgi:hypothetical protein